VVSHQGIGGGNVVFGMMEMQLALSGLDRDPNFLLRVSMALAASMAKQFSIRSRPSPTLFAFGI